MDVPCTVALRGAGAQPGVDSRSAGVSVDPVVHVTALYVEETTLHCALQKVMVVVDPLPAPGSAKPLPLSCITLPPPNDDLFVDIDVTLSSAVKLTSAALVVWGLTANPAPPLAFTSTRCHPPGVGPTMQEIAVEL